MKTSHDPQHFLPRTPSEVLREAYFLRKQKNETYSLRAFARDLGMSQTLLSLVLNQLRPLTLKQAHKVSALLGLNSFQEKEFIEITLAALPENAKVSQRVRLAWERSDQKFLPRDLDVERYRSIASWYHFAILDLTTTHDFRDDAAWISERLGIGIIETKDALQRLLLLKLLERKKGKLFKSALHIHFPTQESKSAVRSFHKQMIEKAKIALEATTREAFEKRSITGYTVAIDSSRIEDAKTFMAQMHNEFVRRFSTGRPDEIYQFNIQLFPLTHKIRKDDEK